MDGVSGSNFAVWAPGANYVSVDRATSTTGIAARHPLSPRDSSGIWEGFLPGSAARARATSIYVDSRHNGHAEKADPFGFFHEVAPCTGVSSGISTTPGTITTGWLAGMSRTA